MPGPRVSSAPRPGVLSVRRVETRRDLARFIEVPWSVYDRTLHAQWVPPLRIQVRSLLDGSNPIWKRMTRELLLAERDGHSVGRIAAIQNPAHNEFHADRVGFFGFFECREDPETAEALVVVDRLTISPEGRDRLADSKRSVLPITR